MNFSLLSSKCKSERTPVQLEKELALVLNFCFNTSAQAEVNLAKIHTRISGCTSDGYAAHLLFETHLRTSSNESDANAVRAVIHFSKDAMRAFREAINSIPHKKITQESITESNFWIAPLPESREKLRKSIHQIDSEAMIGEVLDVKTMYLQEDSINCLQI